jgi:hypothetical protein
MVVPFLSAGAALVFPFMAAQAFAASTNITVDDTNSTVWTFVGKWSAVTPSTPCPGCFAQPDPKQVFNQSWHDGSIVSGSVTFQGSQPKFLNIHVHLLTHPRLRHLHIRNRYDGYLWNEHLVQHE